MKIHFDICDNSDSKEEIPTLSGKNFTLKISTHLLKLWQPRKIVHILIRVYDSNVNLYKDNCTNFPALL